MVFYTLCPLCYPTGDEKSLPPGGRGTTKWWKEPAELSVPPNFIVTHSPSVAFGASSLPEGAFNCLSFGERWHAVA